MTETSYSHMSDMVRSWPAMVTPETEPEICCIRPTLLADHWFSKCREILPDGKIIASDFRICQMLNQASTRHIGIGWTGLLWVFSDQSAILSNFFGDRVYKSWG